MGQNETHSAEVPSELSQAAPAAQVEPAPVEPVDPEARSSIIKAPVECRKCGRRFELDYCPFAPNPIRVRTRGATFAPYLQRILDEEFGPQPDLIPNKSEPPTHVESCRACVRPGRAPREGDTFKRRSYRGKLRTFGRQKGSPVPELDPDTTHDLVDQKLTEAYRNSRYGRGIDYCNQQSRIREQLYERKSLEEAQELLDGTSLRKIEHRWGIPRMTADRGKKAIQAISQPSESHD